MQQATCRTAGCDNEGHPIALDFIDPDTTVDAVLCGACGAVITDVVDA